MNIPKYKILDDIKFERQQRSHLVLKSMLWLVTIVFTLLPVIAIISNQHQFKATNWVFFILALSSACLLVLLYLGYYKFTAISLILIIWSAMVFLIWNGRGIYDAANQAILVIVLFASILINRKAAIIVTALSILNFWIVAVFTMQGYREASMASPINHSRDYTAILISSLVFVLIYEANLSNTIKHITDLLWQREKDAGRIQEKEHNYREIFESVDDAILIMDPTNGHVLDFNLSACSVFGYQKNELLALSFTNLSSSEDGYSQIVITNKINQAIIKGLISFEWRSKRANGTFFWSEVNFKRSVIAGEQRLLAVIRDISERKNAEEQLLLNEEQYRTLISNIPGAVYRCHVHAPWKTLYFSDDVFEITGIHSNRFLKGDVKFGDLMLPDDYLYVDKIVEEALANKKEYLLEYRIRHSNGTIRNIMEKGRARYDDSGAPLWLDGVMFDVTEQKKIAAEHHKLSSLQAAILESAGYAVIATNTDGLINTFNKSAELMLGYAAHELIGKFTPEIFHDANEIANQAAMLTLKLGTGVEAGFEAFISEARNGQPQEYEYTYIRKDGTRFPVILKVNALYDSDNRIYGYLGIAQDIRERKRTEKVLRDNELKFRTLFNSSSDAIFILKNNDILDCNFAAEWILNTSREEIIGKTIYDFSPISQPDVSKSSEKLMQKIQKTYSEDSQFFEWRHCRVNGDDFDAEISLNSLVLEGETFIQAIVRDITEKKLIEKKLIEERNLLRTLIDTLPIIVYIKDVDSKFVLTNKPHFKLLGLDADDVVGHTDFDYYTHDLAMSFYSQEQDMMHNRSSINNPRELVINYKGEEMYFYTTKLPLLDSDNNVIGLVGSGLEVTQIIKAENEIRALNESLEKKVEERTMQFERANKELEAFSYSVSHDLRAPLRHIDGFVKLLYSSIPEPSQNIINYYQKINIATKRMANMIDDLLSFSRLGRKELNKSKLNLNELVTEIIEQLKPDMSNRKIDWELGHLPIITADKGLIRIVFENLISNAIKYTSKKESALIQINAKTLANGMVEIFIKDNGAGFDMNYIDKLFGVFQRLHSNEEFEGTGIGLANVRQIIVKHNGSLSAYGKLNEGACFTISLPI